MNVKLSKMEIWLLRSVIRDKYEGAVDNLLEAKRSRGQYDVLKKAIIATCREIFKKAPTDITEDQLMRLFKPDRDDLKVFYEKDGLSFSQNFIDLCYYYAHGQTREDYRVGQNNQTIEAQLHQLEAENARLNSLQEEKENLEQIVQDLKEDGQIWKHNCLWYANASVDSETAIQEDLKKELSRNDKFMQTIKDLADALKTGLSNAPIQVEEKVLFKMERIKRGQSNYYKQGNYKFYVDKISWLQVNKHHSKELDNTDLPKACFGAYANYIATKKIDKIAHEGLAINAAFLSNFLDMDTQSIYNPVIILAAFKADLSEVDSLELMACYPSYDSEFTVLTDNYSMTHRTWWQDALDKDRCPTFNWEVETEQQTHLDIRLSRPFPETFLFTLQ
jgi:hypothetical protein